MASKQYLDRLQQRAAYLAGMSVQAAGIAAALDRWLFDAEFGWADGVEEESAKWKEIAEHFEWCAGNVRRELAECTEKED